LDFIKLSLKSLYDGQSHFSDNDSSAVFLKIAYFSCGLTEFNALNADIICEDSGKKFVILFVSSIDCSVRFRVRNSLFWRVSVIIEHSLS